MARKKNRCTCAKEPSRWYVLKGSRKDQLPKGVKLFPYRSSMAYNQMRTTLDRGYSSLRRFDPRTANGRRSGYMTTNSLEMAATSTQDLLYSVVKIF
uniref:Uncharacterized protein n=1 Tax=Magallana gigas TaxID=29159 RepID=K1Q3U1_MAGGI